MEQREGLLYKPELEELVMSPKSSMTLDPSGTYCCSSISNVLLLTKLDGETYCQVKAISKIHFRIQDKLSVKERIKIWSDIGNTRYLS